MLLRIQELTSESLQQRGLIVAAFPFAGRFHPKFRDGEFYCDRRPATAHRVLPDSFRSRRFLSLAVVSGLPGECIRNRRNVFLRR